jgi:hypothetical protein
MPTTEQMSTIENTIIDFIASDLRISKKLVTVSVKKGGMGMLNLHNFFTGLQCSWVRRCCTGIIDNWRKTIQESSDGNILTVSEGSLLPVLHPLPSCILSAFDNFKKCFYNHNDNFASSFLFGNPNLVKNRLVKTILDINFIPKNINNNASLCIQDLLAAEETILPRAALQERIGTVISIDNYEKLKTGVADSFKLAKKNKISVDMVKKNLSEFMRGFKKGSKPFRKYLDRATDNNIKLKQKTTVKTFFRLIGTNILSDPDLERFVSLWNLSFMPNRFREFILKFRSNLLGLNSRVAHFNANVNRSCTFCRYNNTVPCPDETFLHLFFECNATKSVLSRLKVDLLPELSNLGQDIEKNFWFTGKNFVSNKIDNIFLELLSGTTMYTIWQCKLKKTIPTFLKVTNDWDFFINNARALNQKLRIDMTANLHICREWDNIVSGRP